MGNRSDREEIRVLTMRNLALRDEIAHVNRRLNDLAHWKDRMRAREIAVIERLRMRREREMSGERNLTIGENILERNRRLQRISDELTRDERGFSNFVQGEVQQCDICLNESVTNYHQCNLCHNTWCLTCHRRLDNCPYCRH